MERQESLRLREKLSWGETPKAWEWKLRVGKDRKLGCDTNKLVLQNTKPKGPLGGPDRTQ